MSRSPTASNASVEVFELCLAVLDGHFTKSLGVTAEIWLYRQSKGNYELLDVWCFTIVDGRFVFARVYPTRGQLSNLALTDTGGYKKSLQYHGLWLKSFPLQSPCEYDMELVAGGIVAVLRPLTQYLRLVTQERLVRVRLTGSSLAFYVLDGPHCFVYLPLQRRREYPSHLKQRRTKHAHCYH